jgi:hypothetical protein
MMEPDACDSDNEQNLSIFARKFQITSIASNPSRWNKEWEKALITLSASADVYPIMSQIWQKDRWDASDLSKMAQSLKDRVPKFHKCAVDLWNDVGRRDGHFVSAWLLLDEGERKRHLMNALTGACEKVSYTQDARALCPEITVSAMLKQRGRAFTDFVGDFIEGAESVEAGITYCLPSEWWNKAVDIQDPWPEEVQFAYELLTVQRNEFIGEFNGACASFGASLTDLLE